MTDDLWQEPRGPHLPDTLMRIPLGVWPFLALAVLAAYGEWSVLPTNGIQDPSFAMGIVTAIVVALSAPLVGAALFYRHPQAHRTLPAVAFGAGLLAFTTVVDAFREPVLNAISPSMFAETIVDTVVVIAGSGYSAIEALLLAFALTYIAVGLADARHFEDGARVKVGQAALLVAAIGSTAANGLLTLQYVGDQQLPFVVGLTSSLVTILAWAYIGWTAFRGWAAGEEPSIGWALVAVAGVGYVVVSVAFSALSVALWIIGPTQTQVPLVYEVAQILSVVLGAFWLGMLAAFWLGLPAEDEPEDVEYEAVEDALEPA